MTLRDSLILNFLTDSSWSTTLLLLISLYLTYHLFLIIYNLTLHPLSSVPGPLIARCTKLYTFHHACLRGGTLIHQLPSLHARYGPVIRLEPNSLHFSSISAYNTIYHPQSATYQFPKSQRYYGAFGVHHELAFITDAAEAKSRRERFFVPEFSRKRVRDVMKPIVVEKFRELIERMVEASKYGAGTSTKNSESGSKSFDLPRACRSATLDIITQVVTGESHDALKADAFDDSLIVMMENESMMREWCRYSEALKLVRNTILPKISAVLKSNVGVGKGILAAVRIVKETKERMEKEAKGEEKGEREEPLLARMFRAGYTEEMVVHEALGQIFAGSDTVANTLTVGLTYLMKNPSLLEKLRAEIDQAWSSNENPTPPPPLEVLDNLPLLEGVVKESLRLASSVPGPLWRVAGDDCIIDDIPVPRGTEVGISAYFVHLNPAYFSNPETFDPFRWIEPCDENSLTEQNAALVPFSKGARVCVGKQLADMELKLGFAMILRTVELRLGETQQEMDLKKLLDFHDRFLVRYTGKNVHVHAEARVGV